MKKHPVVEVLIEYVESGADVEAIAAERIADENPDLLQMAIDAFGSWEALLRQTVVALATPEPSAADEEANPRDVERPERRVTAAASEPLAVIADPGTVFLLPLTTLPAAPDRQLRPLPSGPGADHLPERIAWTGEDMAMVILTDRGQVVAVDRRLLQPWSADAIARPLIERFSGIEPRERAALVAPRRAVREQARFFTVTADGQVKASEASEYARLSSDAMVGSLLREGDRFVAAFAGPARGNVLVASSLAKAIVFDIAELRPQGRKATGVRAIALDEGATAVSAFVCPDDGWLVLATAQGYFKRMRSAEFRAQGRGGGGLQTCRLGHGDTVTDLVSIDLAGDLLVLTSSGRYLRLAAYDVPLLGRSARGDRLVDLDAGERVVQLVAVPAG